MLQFNKINLAGTTFVLGDFAQIFDILFILAYSFESFILFSKRNEIILILATEIR